MKFYFDQALDSYPDRKREREKEINVCYINHAISISILNQKKIYGSKTSKQFQYSYNKISMDFLM